MMKSNKLRTLAAAVLALPLAACAQNGQLSEADMQNWIKSLQVFETEDPGVGKRIYASADGDAPMLGRVYIWNEDNMADRTRPTDNGGNKMADPAGFRPFLEIFTVGSDVQPKGAVVLCAGGAFMFRSNHEEPYPTMRRLLDHGYQVFVLQYRVRPWTMQEGSLDVARAVRYVRAHAADYRIDPKNIATAGYSAGGIQVADEVWHFGKQIDGTVLDSSYRPDALDRIDADPTVVGLIYSFYGQLSIASQDVDSMREAQLPPTFYAYGTEDPFYEQFNINVDCMRRAGRTVEAKVLQGYPHGFGAGRSDDDWINQFDAFMQKYFQH